MGSPRRRGHRLGWAGATAAAPRGALPPTCGSSTTDPRPARRLAASLTCDAAGRGVTVGAVSESPRLPWRTDRRLDGARPARRRGHRGAPVRRCRRRGGRGSATPDHPRPRGRGAHLRRGHLHHLRRRGGAALERAGHAHGRELLLVHVRAVHHRDARVRGGVPRGRAARRSRSSAWPSPTAPTMLWPSSTSTGVTYPTGRGQGRLGDHRPRGRRCSRPPCFLDADGEVVSPHDGRALRRRAARAARRRARRGARDRRSARRWRSRRAWSRR